MPFELGKAYVYRAHRGENITAGQVRLISPSGKYVCLDGKWVDTSVAELLEELPVTEPKLKVLEAPKAPKEPAKPETVLTNPPSKDEQPAGNPGPETPKA